MPALNWQKPPSSSGDGNTNCVEVAAAGIRTGGVRMRESEAPRSVLTLTGAATDGLLRHLKAGGDARPH